MPRGRTASPDNTTLEAALVGLELKRNEIDALIAKIKKQLGGKSSTTLAVTSSASTGKSAGARKKRVLSPEARKRIAAAQKRRWAEHRKAQSKSE